MAKKKSEKINIEINGTTIPCIYTPTNLNMLTWRYERPYSIRMFFRNFKYFFWSIGDSFKRATQGFCRCDWWDLDHFYTQLMIDSLTDYIQNCNGTPFLFGIEAAQSTEWEKDYYNDEETNKLSEHLWKEYVNEIITHLKHSSLELDSETDLDFLKGNRIDKDIYVKFSLMLEEYKTEERRKAFEMLHKVWNNLWD